MGSSLLKDCPRPQEQLEDKNKVLTLASKRPGLLEDHWPWPWRCWPWMHPCCISTP